MQERGGRKKRVKKKRAKEWTTRARHTRKYAGIVCDTLHRGPITNNKKMQPGKGTACKECTPSL